MKFRTILIVVTLLLFVAQTEAKKKEAKSSTKMASAVKAQIGYPETEKFIGDRVKVRVSFTVTEGGKVKVNEINTINATFRNHVDRRLNKLDLSQHQYEPGETYNYKIIFKVL